MLNKTPHFCSGTKANPKSLQQSRRSYLTRMRMKRNQKLKQACFVFGVSAIFIFSTAGSCGSSPDNRPHIKDVFPEKMDIQLDPVFLRYDMSTFINNCLSYGNTYPASDLQELYDYNNVISASSWLNFNSLFNKADAFAGPGAGASFKFTQPDCREDITVSFNKYDDKLCTQNIISNAPKIDKTHLVEFSAHTITTTSNSIYIKWSMKYTATGYGTYMKIDKKGTVEYPNYLFASRTKGGNQIAVRKIDDRLVPIENTVSTELAPGSYRSKLVEERPVISDVLEQEVCIGGRVRTECKWDAPKIVELELL